jgi:hypothetical protein
MAYQWGTGPIVIGSGFAPHFAPPTLNWAFVEQETPAGWSGLVLVEQCGVQWSAVG